MTYGKTTMDRKDRDCILEQIRKIDQEQKEAILERECDTCSDNFVQRIYNTRPVSLYLDCGKAFRAKVPGERDETTYFRIEEVKSDCVLLRILDKEGPKFECTDFTVLLKLDCVCAIQCFPPIWCEKCGKHY